MELKQPKTLIIDRNEWIHGEGNLKSFLLRPSDGKMCCLGFYALSCGLSKEFITNIKTPYDLSNRMGIKLPGLFDSPNSHNSNELSGNLMDTNDQAIKFKSETEREALIIEYFRKMSTEVTFIN